MCVNVLVYTLLQFSFLSFIPFSLSFSLSLSSYAGTCGNIEGHIFIVNYGSRTFVHVLVSPPIQFSSLSLNPLSLSFAFSFCLLSFSLSFSLSLSLSLSLLLQEYVAILRVTYLFSITILGTLWF